MSDRASHVPPVALRVIGWILTVLPAALLIFSASMKIQASPEFLEQFAKSGYPTSIAVPLGIVELVCTMLYLIPPTRVLGAVLLTGYMGGAIATHVRLEEPFVMQFVIGVVIWLGVHLRDRRLWSLLPLVRTDRVGRESPAAE